MFDLNKIKDYQISGQDKEIVDPHGYIFVDFDLSVSCDHNKPAIIFPRELHGPAMVGHYPWNKCLRFSIVICLLI